MMAKTTTREQLRAALSEWHTILHNVASLPQRSKWRFQDAQDVFWITCTALNVADRADLKLQFEALELLARLARVDWKLWRQQVAEIWKQSADVWFDRLRVRRFTVGVELVFDLDATNELNDTLVQICEHIITKNTLRSPDFQRVAGLMDKLELEHDQTSSASTTIPVRLFQYYAEEDNFDASNLLLRILQLVLTQKYFHGSDSKAMGGSQLRIQQVYLNLSYSRIDVVALQYIQEIRSNGVCVCDLPDLNTDHIPSRQSFVSTIQSLLAINSLASTVPVDGIEAMTVTNSLGAPYLPAIFSAIHASQSLRSVYIGGLSSTNDTYAVGFWSWIAYGFFCRPHRILQDLTLQVGNLRVHHVESMRQVLDAANPLGTLFGAASDVQPTHIKASQFTLEEPSDQAPSTPEAHLLVPECEVQVIDQSGEWWTVLLPGWGRAWVHQRDATTQSVHPVIPMQSVSNLALLFMSQESADAVIALLHLIGRDLRFLRIDQILPDCSFDRICQDVFDACPNLEALTLPNGKLVDTQMIVDSYAAGNCRMKRLSFENMSSDIDPILKALSDKTHSITIHVTDLEFSPRISVQGPPPLRQKTLRLGLKMLKNNQRVTTLLFNFYNQQLSQNKRIHFRDAFAAFNRVKLSVRLAPMDIHRKLAFLSVVAGSSEDDTPSKAIHQLDSDVLSVIFQFAAKCRRRRVRVSIHGDE